MKKTFLTSLAVIAALACPAQQVAGYKSLDARNPVIFAGDHIIYQGKTITLGPKAFFIDGQLTDEEASKYPYVFNSINKAAEHLTNGTVESPMVLYIAPYVYWIDDPDDPAVRIGQGGQSPYGLIINCEWLRFYGLSDNAENVVLACNRGQTIGSQGNFTMFRFSGNGTSSENITFGNYCNVDLIYPLKPKLGRVKRASAIVQAQLIFCDGDKIVARNTKFISRLNLMPFVGGKRVLFDRCHFECTDDALCATGVYLNSTLDFYSSKPFYATTGTGAVFLNCELKGETIKWSVDKESESLVELKPSEDGTSCQVIPTNTNDETIEVIVNASTPSGLQAASVLRVAPSKLDPPKFILQPEISGPRNGKLTVTYKLDTKFEDQSLVTWYRCPDQFSGDPIVVAVSRLNKPMLEYELSSGDIGYFITVSVEPKHLRCDAGPHVSVVMKKQITAKDVKADKNVLHTDFLNVPTSNQPHIIPGFWTFSSIESPANNRMMGGGEQNDAWFYGEGTDGAAGQKGLLQGRSGRMLYTPVGNDFGDMKLSMTVAPSKTAGQGFSVAHLYMDVLIKFDTKTMTGYALRFIRTTKYGDAVDCMFVKYVNGVVTEISKPVSTNCYRPTCNIIVEVKGNKIIAHADSPAEYYKIPDRPEVVTEVNIETEINPGRSGGFGIEYNGGAATMIKELKVEWK
jgi:hypothetical protein